MYMASGKIEKVNTLQVINYIPTIGWRYGSTAPTLGANLAYGMLLNKNLLVLGFRINITDLGSPASNEYLTISMPSNVTLKGDPFPSAGVIYNSNGPMNLCMRGLVADNQLQLVDGIGGNPSAPKLSTGWFGGFGFVPISMN